MENGTRDKVIRNETEIKGLKEDFKELKEYLRKHFRNIYVIFGVLILALLSTGIITPEKLEKVLAYILP